MSINDKGKQGPGKECCDEGRHSKIQGIKGLQSESVYLLAVILAFLLYHFDSHEGFSKTEAKTMETVNLLVSSVHSCIDQVEAVVSSNETIAPLKEYMFLI